MRRTTSEAWLASLQSETGSSSSDANALELAFLVGEGYTTGTIDDRWYAYLRAKGYTGSLQDMWNAAEAADDFWPAAAVSCAFTLTGANAGTYGMTAPSITAQRFFQNPTAATSYFANSTDVVADWSSGVRWVEISDYSTYSPNHVNTHAGIMDAATGVTLALQTVTSGGTTTRAIRIHNLITDVNTVDVLIAAGTGAVGLGIDGATGAAYYDIGAGPVALAGAGTTFASTANYVLAGRINGDGTNGGGATFVTAASSFTSVTTGSDLCGNAV